MFRYITLRSFMAAVTALLIGFACAPLILKKLRNLKMVQTMRNANEVGKLADMHSSKKDTPTMGGLIIYVAVTTSVLLWAKPNVYIIVALFVYTTLTILGICDDYLKISKGNSNGLSGKVKLFSQAIISIIAITVLLSNEVTGSQIKELWIPFFKSPVIVSMPIWFLILFFFFVLAGSSNAINLTDGVDGLAIGCTITVALVYGVMAYATGHMIIAKYLFISYLSGSGELAIVCFALVGASLTFLWYNAHPAMIFMGDTGSLALGGLIGVVAFMVHQPITLILVGGIFVVEALSVIIQVASFKTFRKRVFKMAPIHHHFELLGWAETQVVTRFWILSLIFAITGLATLKIR